METDHLGTDCQHCDNAFDLWTSSPAPARDITEIARELAVWEHWVKHSTATRDRLRDELIDAHARELEADERELERIG